LGERAKFYRGKEGRWAFHPKLEASAAVSLALQRSGISSEEVKILQKLTDASLAIAYPKAHKKAADDIRKHISLPLTQAFMSQRLNRAPALSESLSKLSG
jgi:hypothetical protein